MKNNLLLVLLGVFVSLFLGSCAKGPYYRFNKEAKIKKLGVQLVYQDSLYEMLGEDYDLKLNKYIEDFNKRNHAFTLYRTENGDSNALKIRIYYTRLATAQDQIKATAITALGSVAAPFVVAVMLQSPIYFLYWRKPLNVSLAEVSLSPDLASHPKIRFHKVNLYSNAYYGGKKRQLKKHMRRTYGHIHKIIKPLEANYVAQRKMYERRMR